MFQRDYILRLIEMFVKVLARVLKLKEQKQYDQALVELGEAYRSLLGIPSQFVHSMSDVELINFLKQGDQFTPDKLAILAELLKEEAEVLSLQDQLDDAGALYVKSLSLFLEAVAHDRHLQTHDYFSKIDRVIFALQDYELPVSVKRRLMTYYEFRGRYGDAENVLFELIDEQDPEIVQAGISFYERMSLKSYSELIKGNLPPEEVVEGLREFQRKLGIEIDES